MRTNTTGWTGVLAVIALCPEAGAADWTRTLRSPDGQIEVRIDGGEALRYSVSLGGKPLLKDAELWLDVDHVKLGPQSALKSAKPASVDRTIEPPVRQKAEKLREHFNELRLEMNQRYTVVFRAFDEGIAYRFETSLPQTEVKVYGEGASFRFAADLPVYYPKETSFFSHQEREYLALRLKDVAPDAIASLPAVVDAGEGTKVAVAESDVEGYPGLWLRGSSGSALNAVFPPFPLEEKLERDRDFKVVKAADYLAVTTGTRTYPWRILAVSRKDADLLTNSMVYLLAKPSRIADTSWIKPGKVAWDWWNANNVHGVDFKSGVNTATYKYFIDFASRYGIEYVILDEGWYPLGDLLSVVPAMDMEELVRYARAKKVGLILWVVAKTLEDQFEPALAKFEKWGAAGIKVDFMQRDDQKLIDFYHRVCAEAAKRKMLVDYHGTQRTALMTRTWPNLISTEGVRGLEQVKWSDYANPEHNLMLPFTRMLLGPMDYTPGAMVNAAKKNFVKVFDAPMSLGTRAHQLAMYVVYESPLQMLADSPSNYLREPEAMEFLAPVPSVWDETRVLDAKFADYVLVARRRGREWWVGAMTDWTAREIELDFSFLPPGSFALDAFADGVNADRWGSDTKRLKQGVDRSTKLRLKLAEGGGWAARLTPSN
jgi:alpha-glucosidase